MLTVQPHHKASAGPSPDRLHSLRHESVSAFSIAPSKALQRLPGLYVVARFLKSPGGADVLQSHTEIPVGGLNLHVADPQSPVSPLPPVSS